jgi:FAD synthase
LKYPDQEFNLTDSALCLGNFDGVHRGHRALIDELKKKNAERAERLPMGALLFSTPPSFFLSPTHMPEEFLCSSLKLIAQDSKSIE